MSASVSFQSLWDNHPSNLGDNEPCTDEDGYSAFGNQCAIRMGVALKGAGVTVPKKKGLVHCWTKGHKDSQHVLRAEELAAWIVQQKSKFGEAEKKVGSDWDSTNGVDVSHYSGRQGVVFFKDFWQRSGESERNPTGDHIDVWDGSNQGSGSDGYFQRSKQIWFWELA